MDSKISHLGAIVLIISVVLGAAACTIPATEPTPDITPPVPLPNLTPSVNTTGEPAARPVSDSGDETLQYIYESGWWLKPQTYGMFNYWNDTDLQRLESTASSVNGYRLVFDLDLINADFDIVADIERVHAAGRKYVAGITFNGIIEKWPQETSLLVAAGALAKQLLAPFGIRAMGYVVQLGGIDIDVPDCCWDERLERRGKSVVYGLDPRGDAEIIRRIDETGKAGDTLGGVVEVCVEGLPFGLGTHAQWDQKLDGRLAQAVMAVQAIKGVEIGMGFEAARRPGSQVHDPIQYDAEKNRNATLGYARPTNNAGGLEAGMTNGQPLVMRAAMKPISTLRKPLESINLDTKQSESAEYERSDVCAVSAASVIMENVVAFEVARAMVDKFGGDSLQEMRARWDLFHQMARQR